MSKEEDYIECDAEVLECLPDKKYRLSCNSKVLLGYILGGKPNQRKVKIYPGNKVRIKISVYDSSRALILSKI